MTVHDDKSLDAELDLLRAAPAPRTRLRHDVLAAVAREPRDSLRATEARDTRHARPAAQAPGGSLLEALAALWRDLGGARLAAPAFAMALAAGVGLSWFAEGTASIEDSGDDLLALAQLDDAYAGLEP